MIRPVRNNVVVRPLAGNVMSTGGIIVPESSRKPSNKVEIISVGAMVKKLKVGQVGFRVKDWGDEIWKDGVQYFIMNEDAIIATLN